MSKQMTCATCAFFKDGTCRRFPPTPVAVVDADRTDGALIVQTHPPKVSKSFWCGEWTSGRAERRIRASHG